MLNKRIVVLALILLSFITISGVSASEITNDTSDLLSNTNDDSINVNDDVPNGTFKDLAREIANADGELNLTRNYVYSKGDDNYKSGINIGEKITINGNGFDIDGNGQARAFNISAADVCLNNINFVNYVGGDGSAVYWTGDNGSIADCSFVNCYSYGAAVYWCGANGNVVNCSFSDNYIVDGDDLFVRWTGVNGRLANCIFKNNYIDGDDETFYYYFVSWSGANGTVVNCSIFHNTVTYGGCFLYWGGADGRLVDCSFSGNSDLDLVIWYGANGSLVGCSFSDNNVYKGDIFGKEVTFVKWGGVTGCLANCNFNKNNIRGGEFDIFRFVYLMKANGVVVNCSFSDNILQGGMAIFVYCNGVDGSLVGCSFFDNTIIDDDGILCSFIVWYGVNGCLANCNFSNNVIGADFEDFFPFIYWEGANGALTNCNFVNNQGALYWRGVNGSITNCNFLGNIGVLNDFVYDYGGGAVYWEADNGSVIGCSFANNSASVGGAVYWYGANGTIVNSSFMDNKAISDNDKYGGGAVYWKGVNGSVIGCSFANNSARCGGAIYYSGAEGAIIVNSSFMDNKAKSKRVFYNDNKNLLTLRFAGNNNYINAIFANNFLTFKNVSYYNGAIVNSDDVSPINSQNEAGISITVEVYSGNTLVDKVTLMTGINGKVSYNYLKLDDGVYNFTAYHVADSYYNSIKTKGNFTVDKSEVNLSAVYDDIDQVLIVGLVDAVSGVSLKGANVVVVINGEKYKVSITSSGRGKLSLAGWTPGSYSADIAYKGSSYYSVSNMTLNFDIVDKSAVNLSAVYDDTSKELTVGLVDAVTGAPLKGAYVVVVIGDENYKVRIASSGYGKLSFADWASGSYTADLTYKGNVNYRGSNANLNFDIVDKAAVNLSVVYNGYNKALIVILVNANTGDAIRGANVILTINNTNYSVKTIYSGKGIFSLKDFEPGDYSVTATYKGNANYTSCRTDLNFTKVIQKDVNLSLEYDGVYKRIVVSLVDATTGKGLKGATVFFSCTSDYRNGQADLKINSEGEAVYIPWGFEPNEYRVSATYRGSANYNSARVSEKFIINM